MRQLFKDKVSNFGSFISLIAITAMLTIFSLVLPDFVVRPAGRIFAAVWAIAAIMVFVAHGTRLGARRQYSLTHFVGKKDVRASVKPARTKRMMQG